MIHTHLQLKKERERDEERDRKEEKREKRRERGWGRLCRYTLHIVYYM